MAKKKEEFKKEKEIFLEHIQKAGLRRTGQRDLIMEIFLRTEEHLTSEDLYWLVQKDDPSVGHTTVYRTLKLLTEAGLAREVRFGDNKTYYEHHYNHEHHDHMICTECGRVIEFFHRTLNPCRTKWRTNSALGRRIIAYACGVSALTARKRRVRRTSRRPGRSRVFV